MWQTFLRYALTIENEELDRYPFVRFTFIFNVRVNPDKPESMLRRHRPEGTKLFNPIENLGIKAKSLNSKYLKAQPFSKGPSKLYDSKLCIFASL